MEDENGIVIKTLVSEDNIILFDSLNIPMFISMIDDITNMDTKEEISRNIRKYVENADKKTINEVFENNNNYKIVDISNVNHRVLIANTFFAPTINRVCDYIRAGIEVKSINFFFEGFEYNDNILYGTKSGNNDPSYWEGILNYLGTYNGYKFLYSESSVSVSTSWSNYGLSSSFNWGSFLSKTAESTAQTIIGASYPWVAVAWDTISNILGSVTNPYSVTYGSSGGYVKTRVEGDDYLRVVYIRDLNNRISGYAYYEWGSTEQTRLQQGIETKYPISKRTSTTYNYYTTSNFGNTYTYSTPGFYGGSSFLSTVLSYYNNTLGYYTYNESINISSVIASIY